MMHEMNVCLASFSWSNLFDKTMNSS